jgi:ubiquinol-cytochrome c reductase iron-sulfur subunit
VSRRTVETLVSLCFLSTAAAAAVFITAYVQDWGEQALGAAMGAGFATLAVGLLLWSRLLPRGEFVQAREPLEPADAVQTAFVDEAKRGGSRTPVMVRRTLLLSGLGLTAAAVVPLKGLVPSADADPARALAVSEWRGGGKRLMTHDGKLVRASEVPVGTEVTVFPEGHPEAYYAQAVLIRLSPADTALLRPSVARGTDRGLIAYSKMCTHAGCPVGLYEQTSRQLFCPCHQSVFDVLDAGRAVAGPAGRALPRLPIRATADDVIVATGDFDGQPGPTFWKSYGSSA